MSEDEDQAEDPSLDDLLVVLEDTPRTAAWRKRARGKLGPKKSIDRKSALTEDQQLELEILKKKRRTNSVQKSKAKRREREKEKREEEEEEREEESRERTLYILDIRGPDNGQLLEFWKRREVRDRDDEGETRRTLRDMRPESGKEDDDPGESGDGLQASSGRGSSVDYLPPDDWTAD